MLCKPRSNRWKRERLAVLSLLVGLSSCVAAPPSPVGSPTTSAQTSVTGAPHPLVVATNTVVCDLTRQLAADTITLKCLIDAGADPHEYAPKPDDRRAIEQAALIFYGGYGFEPQLIKLINATSNSAPKVAVDEAAVADPQTFEEDGKTVPDPHVFHNAANGARMAAVISKQLAQLKPDKASFYAAKAKKVETELTQIHRWIAAQTMTIPIAQRKLVTTHDAFGYYSKAYGIPIQGALQGIDTEEKATPTRVKDLVKDIQTTQVPVIFAETTANAKLIETVAKEAKVSVSKQALFADGLGEKGTNADTYQRMLIANTQAIVTGLGGRFTPFYTK